MQRQALSLRIPVDGILSCEKMPGTACNKLLAGFAVERLKGATGRGFAACAD